MNVFVTGATGVLGKPVVRLLVEAGYQVSALSHSEANTTTIQQLSATPVVADLFERESLIRALSSTRADAIIHLASRIPPTSRMGKLSSWQENDRIRRDGTRTLVEAALATDIQTMIYPSFYFVYPDRGDAFTNALAQSVGKRRLFRIPHQVMKLLAGAAGEMASRSQRVSNCRFQELTSWRPAVPNAREGWALISQTVNGAPASGHVERNSAYV